MVDATGEGDRALAEPEDPQVTYGLAEFIAAEEMHRYRGFWWSPESDRLLVARADESPVQRWYIADPAHPERRPAEVAYPAAGTPNAEVRIFVMDLEGDRTEVVWDREAFPYLAQVHWSSAGAPLLLVQARDQRSQRYLAVDPETGATRIVHVDEDPVWLDLFPGCPRGRRTGGWCGSRTRAVRGCWRSRGPAAHRVAAARPGGAGHRRFDFLISAVAGEDAVEPEIGQIHVYRVNELRIERISEGVGVHSAVRSGALSVVVSAASRGARNRRVDGAGRQAAGPDRELRPGTGARRPRDAHRGGARRIPCAVLLPSDYQESDGPLPVLLDPYGGPHGRRVVAAHNPHLTSQWFADQGFAVVVADGRGAPGRSPAWEKAVRDDFTLTLDDQIEALEGLAGRFPLDLSRVAIRGWSYGGYLAGLAALRRPDVFHAAVVGAPVTDWRLYDTHYTERYLGDPARQPEVYAANSLVTDDGLTEPSLPRRAR